ncbi:MAG: hypothetical protein ACP5N7_03260 [Candidatus Pacearchaeota archaeon]
MDFQLTKEEIPIWGADRTGFYVPIHPILLDKNTQLNPRLANEVFPQVAQEWHEDLKSFLNGDHNLDRETEDFYRRFLKNKPPRIVRKFGEQTLDSVMGWRDDVTTDERGFATGLSISRNGGGTLFYNPSMGGNEYSIQLDGKPNKIFNISAGKARQLAIDNMGRIKVYDQHNIDYFPGALFLRNWALAYVNAAMKSIEQ